MKRTRVKKFREIRADLCDSVTDNFRLINPKDFGS